MAAGQVSHGRRLPIRGHPARLALVLIGGGLPALLLLLPLGAVYYYAFRDGFGAYIGYLSTPSTRHAIWLSLLTIAVSVPINTVFGIVAAYAISKFEFFGKKLLISLIELPLSISPIVLGVAYVFVFGMQGLLGEWLLDKYDIRMVFNVAAVLIVTTIVTCPFVFREVLPLMQTQGTDDEVAALSLGAGGLTTFFRVTLPNIKWALLYGICLCLARGLGEFGSVIVVSGSIPNQTNTMTLQIELLSHDLVATGSFAVATVLTSFSLVTIAVKWWIEYRERRQVEEA